MLEDYIVQKVIDLNSILSQYCTYNIEDFETSIAHVISTLPSIRRLLYGYLLLIDSSTLLNA